MKYQRFTPIGSKNIGLKNLSLWQRLNSFVMEKLHHILESLYNTIFLIHPINLGPCLLWHPLLYFCNWTLHLFKNIQRNELIWFCKIHIFNLGTINLFSKRGILTEIFFVLKRVQIKLRGNLYMETRSLLYIINLFHSDSFNNK